MSRADAGCMFICAGRRSPGNLTWKVMKMSDADPWDNLSTRVWKTKESRFNATRRLKGQYRCSAQTLALLSTYMIILQCWLALAGETVLDESAWLWTVLTIGLALVILVLGLLEQNKEYRVRAERLMRSAMELNRLSDRIAVARTRDADDAEVAERTEEYHDILATTTENHATIDYQLWQTEDSAEHELSGWDCLKIRVRYWVRVNHWYWAAIAPWIILVVGLLR